MVELVTAHFGIKQNWQPLAGYDVKTLNSSVPVVGLKEHEPHHFVGLCAKREEGQGDLQMFTWPVSIVAGHRHMERQIRRPGSWICFVPSS